MFILWTAIIFAVLAIAIGLIITIAQKIFAVKEDPIVEKIDAILPQTQCGQCGYPGCLPYAKALANGDEINKCVPGGQELVVKLAELLDREVPAGKMEEPEDLIAIIREKDCIGCLHCIEACPVDAIIGAKKLLHVIVPDYCTGCKLCVEPCPVKCIDMIPRPKEVNKYSKIREESNFPRGVTSSTLIKVTNVPPSSAPYFNLNTLNENEVEQASKANEQATSYNSKLVARLAAKIAESKSGKSN
ncbi:electron transport complex subunit RsxB [Psittacicella melopsittaci]|nr:electron transport complex subunit RsxB [Psittacicella melopsittaci]